MNVSCIRRLYLIFWRALLCLIGTQWTSIWDSRTILMPSRVCMLIVECWWYDIQVFVRQYHNCVTIFGTYSNELVMWYIYGMCVCRADILNCRNRINHKHTWVSENSWNLEVVHSLVKFQTILLSLHGACNSHSLLFQLPKTLIIHFALTLIVSVGALSHSAT